MRIVDIHTFPNEIALHGRLLSAWEELGGDRGERADPIDPAAPLAIGFPADLSDDEVRKRADAVRDRLSAALGDDVEVRIQIADGPSAPAGGSPDHTD